MNIGSKYVVKGTKAFDSFLRMERSRFAASPILLIASEPDTTPSGQRQQQQQSTKVIDDTCRYVAHVLQLQMNFRTVVTHPASGYKYPTVNDVEVAVTLANRVGAKTVAAVGSGSAIDLAKAIVHTADQDFENLILIPATYGGIFTAGTSHSLLLDPKEEALLVSPPFRQSSNDISSTIINLDRSQSYPFGSSEAVLAATSILLDILNQGLYKGDDEIESLLRSVADLLDSINGSPSLSDNDLLHDNISKFLIQVANHVSYGLDHRYRSVPLAIVSALQPVAFPDQSPIDVMASLTRSICRQLQQKGIKQHSAVVDKIMNKYANNVPLAVSTLPSSTLLSEIHSNQALWKCFDVKDNEFRSYLEDSLLQ